METEYAIEVNDLTKVFNNGRGSRKINFKVERGSFHVLIGENGAGKTTIIRSLLRLYQEYSGEIIIDGINNSNPQAFKNVGYISETAQFPNAFSVYKYLYWAGILRGVEKNKVKALIDENIRRFNLQKSKKSNPNKLSSGEKKKVLLIKSIIEGCNILIMDEPTANLDPTARLTFFDEIKEMRKNGITIFICSHDLVEIQPYATHTTIISSGEVVHSSKLKSKTLIDLFKEFAYRREGDHAK